MTTDVTNRDSTERITFKWLVTILIAIVVSLVAAWGNSFENRTTRITERVDELSVSLPRIEAKIDVLIQQHKK